jgi:hypothetical protein
MHERINTGYCPIATIETIFAILNIQMDADLKRIKLTPCLNEWGHGKLGGGGGA